MTRGSNVKRRITVHGSGYQALLGAVLAQAVEDLRSDGARRRSAQCWFLGEPHALPFGFVAEQLEFRPDRMLAALGLARAS